MKLIKFRIFHYKSIRDSGDCWLASDVTTLAGKNESGKSGILEALRDFDTKIKTIPDEANPLDQGGDPTIEQCYKINKKELDSIAQKTGISIDNQTRKYISENGVALTKDSKGNYYLKDQDLKKLLNHPIFEHNKKFIANIRSNIAKLRKFETLKETSDLDFLKSLSETKEDFDQLIATTSPLIQSLETQEEKKRSSSLFS